MRVSNGTTNDVNYNQTGSNPQERADPPPDESGKLDPGEETPPFDPSGNAPWYVTFSNGHTPVTSDPINKAGVTVTLNDDWTISITS